MSVHPLPISAGAAPVAKLSVTPAASAQAVSKLYAFKPVLRKVSFSIAPGSSVVLFGANGAGKTTLLRMLATLAKPSSGRLSVMGLDVRRDATSIRSLIGVVAHQPHLYDELTVRENLLFFGRLYGLSDCNERADRLLERVGLAPRAHERVRALSRGQAQRLALARGVMHEPRVLLMDEPDTGLDEDGLALLEEIVREREGYHLTTILTTHQIARGLGLCSRAMVLSGGRLTFDGASSDLTKTAVRDLYHGGSGGAL